MRNKRGQVTVFIIIAVLIVVGVVLYFSLRSVSQQEKIPASFQPVYTSFMSCLESDLETGISVLESQGGYIYLPDFEPGSEFMPFSSQLNFLGNPIPYWYYVSGNNIGKEQVPTQGEMEDQLALFVADKIDGCDFSSYYDDGFEISLSDEVTPRIVITDGNVELHLDVGLSLSKEEENVMVRNHRVRVNSNLGKLYKSAKKVYDEEQENLFLEEYAVDTLRLYAPVDGVEISCSPQIWIADDVVNDLQNAIEQNTGALHSDVSVDDYFIVEIPGVNEEVRFLNSKDWPHSFEITPSDGSLLMSNPVGNQPGLGIMGFCYVPYHFIYDVKYPVLVQVSEDDETFQFPMPVVIQNNNPRESLDADALDSAVPELCEYKNTPVNVMVRDKRGVPVKADISYECFGNSCFIGETYDSGFLSEDFPQCANGFVTARAEGFKDTSYLFSTVESGSLTIVMDKIYTKRIQLSLEGVDYNGEAIIYFTSDDFAQTVIYPDQKSVELAEGQYEVQVYVYDESEITFGERIAEQCVEVPRSGFLGIVGLKEERCFDIEVPEQVISQVLSGGGKQDYYILDSELIGQGNLEIDAERFPVPETIEQLNVNHLLFEESGLEVNFR